MLYGRRIWRILYGAKTPHDYERAKETLRKLIETVA